MDFALIVSDVGSKDFNGDNGSTAGIDAETSLGFMFGYNMDNHWNFGLDISWRQADYSKTTTPAVGNVNPTFTASGTIDVSTTAFTATYHFSPAQFTPLITANVGRTWIDTN